MSRNGAHHKAERHLARHDPVLKELIRRVGPCTLRYEPDGYSVLVRSIIAQQISSKAAISIGNKVLATLRSDKFTPKAFDRASDEKLRKAGLSSNKLLSLRDLTARVLSTEVPLARLPEMEDEEVIEALIPVRGIGRWTAEMFLIFSLGRLDVLPVGDYGLRVGVKNQYRLRKVPEKDRLTKLTEPWRPFRSIGTWFMWRSFGNVPQS